MLGAEFAAGAARLMPWIALATLLNGVKLYHFDRSFHLREKTHEQIWVAAGAAAVSMGLNVLLIPSLALPAPRRRESTAYAVAIFLSITLGRRHYRMPFPWRTAARIPAAAAVMAGILWPLRGLEGPLALLRQIAAGAAAYGLAMIPSTLPGSEFR